MGKDLKRNNNANRMMVDNISKNIYKLTGTP